MQITAIRTSKSCKSCRSCDILEILKPKPDCNKNVEDIRYLSGSSEDINLENELILLSPTGLICILCPNPLSSQRHCCEGIWYMAVIPAL